MGEILTRFDIDEAKTLAIRPCIDDFGIGEDNGVGGGIAEWPNNMLSYHTVLYECGAFARRTEPIHDFAVDEDELARCRRLSDEAKSVVGEMEVGMGSESGEGFVPFFITADVRIARPERIDEEMIRSRFGHTIFPLATMTVEPLREEGVWWSEVTTDGASEEEEERHKYLEPWRAMIAWFSEREEFVDTAFVRVGEYNFLHGLDKQDFPLGTILTPCVLPRLALGLTRGGSLCGLFGWSVQT